MPFLCTNLNFRWGPERASGKHSRFSVISPKSVVQCRSRELCGERERFHNFHAAQSEVRFVFIAKTPDERTSCGELGAELLWCGLQHGTPNVATAADATFTIPTSNDVTSESYCTSMGPIGEGVETQGTCRPGTSRHGTHAITSEMSPFSLRFTCTPHMFHFLVRLCTEWCCDFQRGESRQRRRVHS